MVGQVCMARRSRDCGHNVRRDHPPRPTARAPPTTRRQSAYDPQIGRLTGSRLSGRTLPRGAIAVVIAFDRRTVIMRREDCILFSGAAGGAEAEFGAAAERHGIEEVNFTFEGHKDARRRGIRVLTSAELQHGDVSLAYVAKLMHRRYPETALFKKVLQSIWHQVNNGQEIYVVGVVQPDGTVKGGTGWGAEFAKLCNKPLFVFDQDRDAWFRWTGEAFEPASAPTVAHPHFTG